MVKNRLIQHDKSNDACYITIAEITIYRGTVLYCELWPCCFPTYQAAMNFFKPQIEDEWGLRTDGGYEARLKHNCDLNHDRPGQAISVQLKQLLLYKLEDCISMEAEKNENKVGKGK